MKIAQAIIGILLMMTIVGCSSEPPFPTIDNPAQPMCPTGQHIAAQSGLVDTRPWEAATNHTCVQILQSGVVVDANRVEHTAQTCYYCTT